MEWNPFLSRLGIEHPILQAPMAGGPSTPELVAAVSNAGSLGSLGGGYQTPEQLAADIRRVRELTEKPFNVNLFSLDYRGISPIDPAPMLAVLAAVHASQDLPPPVSPAAPRDLFSEQFEAVMKAKPAVFSFTFGIPAPAALARARSLGVVILGTATTIEEGRLLEAAGVDAIVAQGAEAGAHRGTFAGPFEDALVPTIDLVRGITAAVTLPVIASGGLMNGWEIARALQAGASAAQLGTAFLPCPESGAPEAHKRALLAAKADSTIITRAFSGRPARGMANAFTNRLGGKENFILPYPQQNALTRPIRAAAARRGDPEYLALWAGQGVARSRALPAAELVRALVAEMQAGPQAGLV